MNEVMRIGDICDILNGYAFKSSKYVTDGIRVIRITNVQKGFVEDTNPQYYPVSEQREIEKYMLCEGDLLMSLTGNVGRVGLLSAEMLPAALNQRVACIRIRNPAVIYKPFLFHLLNSDYFENKCILASQGVAQKNMSTEWLKEYPIPSFSMDKQMEIASIFDKIDDLIAHRKDQVRNMDQAVKSRFIELFGDPETNPKGWTRQRLDQICENLDSRRVPITSTDRKAGNYPYYGASGIVDYVKDYIFDEDILLISEDGANLVMRSTPIAFSVSGKVWVNNHAHVVRFESKATQKYIEICFALTDISGSITGTAQPKLNQAKLNAMMFCVPPIELQEQFATFVEQTDKSKYYSSLSFRYCQAAANTYRQEWMTCRTSDF